MIRPGFVITRLNPHGAIPGGITLYRSGQTIFRRTTFHRMDCNEDNGCLNIRRERFKSLEKTTSSSILGFRRDISSVGRDLEAGGFLL